MAAPLVVTTTAIITALTSSIALGPTASRGRSPGTGGPAAVRAVEHLERTAQVEVSTTEVRSIGEDGAMDTFVARHVVVSGRVQGVGFRYLLERQAAVAGVAGWVRNTPEGTVEAILEGPLPAVDDVLGWMRRGPRGAVVVSVDVTEVAPQGLAGFTIR